MNYATIVADPPWLVAAGRTVGDYRVENGKQVFGVRDNGARKLQYPSMTIDEIKSVNVPAAPDAHLYLWTVNRYLEAAFSVARSWGFGYPSAVLVWAKKPMGGGLGGDAFGLATEFCLFCRRGSLRPKERVGRNWFDWKRPYFNGYPRHSAKPPEFMELVERVSPGPYLELFARSERKGWTAIGDELGQTLGNR